MAVTTTNRLVTYQGNNTAVLFPFAFKVFLATDLFVVQTDSGGDITPLALNTDYSANLNANQDITPGGFITLTAALPNGYSLAITSMVPELQQVVLTNLGGFFPNIINGALDRLTILIQQLQVIANHAIQFALTDSSSPILPPAAARANQFLYFGSDGNISLVAAGPVGTSMFSGSLFGAQDGTNKIFSLTNGGSLIGVTPLQVTVWNNFPLIPGVGYALGPIAGEVTFTTAPSPTDSLFASGVFSL